MSLWRTIERGFHLFLLFYLLSFTMRDRRKERERVCEGVGVRVRATCDRDREREILWGPPPSSTILQNFAQR